MNIHIATQGTSTSPILEGLRHYSVDKLILLHNSGSYKTALQVKEYAESIGISTELKQIDMFNQQSIILEIVKLSKIYKNDDIFINITGGTKLMSASATIAGYIIGATTYYVVENISDEQISISDLIIELPLPKASAMSISGIRRQIIELIAERGKITGITTLIRDLYGISVQKASYHLKKLEQLNLIYIEKTGRSNIVKLTPEGAIVAAMFS